MSCGTKHEAAENACAAVSADGGCAVVVCNCGSACVGAPLSSCAVSDAGKVLGMAMHAIDGMVREISARSGVPVDEVHAEVERWRAVAAKPFKITNRRDVYEP